jgi:hypothetical protein
LTSFNRSCNLKLTKVSIGKALIVFNQNHSDMEIEVSMRLFNSVFMGSRSKTATVITLTVVISFLLVTAHTASAETSIFKKGANLLKGFGFGKTQGQLTTEEIGSALKEALRIGTESVVSRLGQADGFNGDSNVHIPLPENFKSVQSILGKMGMSGMLDDLELRLNRAAETATPKAKTIFWQAITEMTLDDIQAIYKGPEDAATRYFQRKMSPSLAEVMHPVIENSLSEVGAIRSYDNTMAKYKSVPFVPDIKSDLTNHVTTKGMEGIFHYLAKEEAAIRKDPAKRTTDLLKRVFGVK